MEALLPMHLQAYLKVTILLRRLPKTALATVHQSTENGGNIDTTAPSITIDTQGLGNDATPTISGTTDLNAGDTVSISVTDNAGIPKHSQQLFKTMALTVLMFLPV